MTKADLIDEVSKLAELTRKDSEVIVETIFDSIVRSLRVGDKIEIRGFGSFRMPSMTPIASLYGAIPVSGALIALFALEQLVNGWRNGFDHPSDDAEAGAASAEQVGF